MHKKNNCCEVHRSGVSRQKTPRFLIPLFACMLMTSACSLWPGGGKGDSTDMPSRTASSGATLEMPGQQTDGAKTIAPPSAVQTIDKLAPPSGMNTSTRLFAEPVQNTDLRITRIEQAVQDLRDDFDKVAPSIARLVAVEKDMKELLGQLRTLVVTPPQQARANATAPQTMGQPMQVAGQQNAPSIKPSAKASGTAVAKAVRFGEHVDKTRLVIDLKGETSYTASVDNGRNILSIELPGVADWSAQRRWNADFAPLVTNYTVVPNDGGGFRLNAKLKHNAEIASKMMIPPRDGKSERLVIDLYSSSIHSK